MIQKLELKSKIWKIFKNHNLLEECSVRIYKIDPYFHEHYERKIKVDNNGHKYILFKIDIYFSEYYLAVKIDEKGHTDRDLILEEIKKIKSIRKKLGCKFIRSNTSGDLDYEIGNIHAFIDEFKNEKNKKFRKTINKRKRNWRDTRKRQKIKNN